MPFTSHPGPVIRAVRQAAGITQAGLAERTGLDPSWLNHIERGRRRGESFIVPIAGVLGVHPDVLAGRASPVRDLRRLRGLTAQELAKAAKITPQALADIEDSAEIPDPVTAQRLGRRLGVDPAALAPAAQAAA